MTLRIRILSSLTPLVVLPMTLLGWIAFEQLRDDARSRTDNQIGIVLDQAELLLRHEISAARANAAVLAENGLLGRYLLTDSRLDRYALLQPSLLRLLEGYQRVFPEYFDIRIFLPDGSEDVRSNLRPSVAPLENDPVRAHIRRIITSPEDTSQRFMIDADSGEPRLLVSHRVRLKDRSVQPLGAEAVVRGYLVISSDVSSLVRQVDVGRVGDNGYLFFTTEAGLVLSHPDRDEVGTLFVAAEEFLAASEQDALWSNTRLAAEKGRIIWGRKLADQIFGFVSVPAQDLIASGQRVGWLVAAATLLAMLLLASALFLMIERLVVRPIRGLRSVTKEMAAGNLLARVNVGGATEINELANAFREMGIKLHEAADEARFLAHHDHLTGLPNRSLFQEYLATAVSAATRRKQRLAVIFIDLDNFKQVNDTLGHQRGDLLLASVSSRINDCLRAEDIVARDTPETRTREMLARLGGDEFTVLLPDIRTPLDAGHVARRILDVLSAPLTVDGHKLYVGASIGITVFPDDGNDPETLVKNADIAMYHAKSGGKNQFHYFSPDMDEKVARRQIVEQRLRDVLERQKLELLYQPIIDTRSGRIAGVEALVRWSDDVLGDVPREEFIPIAEESGLICHLGEWVLRQACRHNRGWRSLGADIFTAVNLSGIQISRGDLVALVKAVLADTGLEPGSLRLEISEAGALSGGRDTGKVLSLLDEYGVQVSLDDFGTGFGSLRHLQELPISGIEIDRSLLTDIEAKAESRSIVKAIIAFGHGLGLKVTAEGVETEWQREFLSSFGCDFMQGWLFGEPCAARQIEQHLQRMPAEITVSSQSGGS